MQEATATGHRPPQAELERQLEDFRGELTGYCYRMLGSTHEAQDAVQDTMIRAWRSLDRFEGRSALRSWLYRIATNVCLDSLGGKDRRTRPMDLGPAQPADAFLGEPLAETMWVTPFPTDDPAEAAEQREDIRLAFIAALQHLPPKQRAVLILREVLHWKASEVAELLDTSVASVNSALQRARAGLDERVADHGDPVDPMDDDQKQLLARYVDAFERYDMTALTAVLRDDAMWNMPPYALWLRGHEDIVKWCLGQGHACEGSRLLPTIANGMPAFGQYKPGEVAGVLEPWSLQVLEIEDGTITGVTFFLDTESLFPLFGLPDRVEAHHRLS